MWAGSPLCVCLLWTLFGQSNQLSDNFSTSLQPTTTTASAGDLAYSGAESTSIIYNISSLQPTTATASAGDGAFTTSPVRATSVVEPPSPSPTPALTLTKIPSPTTTTFVTPPTSLSISTSEAPPPPPPGTTQVLSTAALSAVSTTHLSSLALPASVETLTLSLVLSSQETRQSLTTSREPMETPATDAPSTSSRSFIEFVQDNPIAVGMVIASVLFVTCMCSILCCVVVWRRRRGSVKRERRRKSILSEAGDVWIVNQGAELANSAENISEPPPQRQAAAINALQTTPEDAVIIINPSSHPPPHYHELQHHQSASFLPPAQAHTPLGKITSTTSLMTQIDTTISQQRQPSAPPRDHI